MTKQGINAITSQEIWKIQKNRNKGLKIDFLAYINKFEHECKKYQYKTNKDIKEEAWWYKEPIERPRRRRSNRYCGEHTTAGNLALKR